MKALTCAQIGGRDEGRGGGALRGILGLNRAILEVTG